MELSGHGYAEQGGNLSSAGRNHTAPIHNSHAWSLLMITPTKQHAAQLVRHPALLNTAGIGTHSRTCILAPDAWKRR
jgi:hypothetical protein